MNRKPIHERAASACRGPKVARWAVALAATSILAGGLVPTAQAELVNHGISAGLIGVSQLPDTPVGNTNFKFELLLSINDFRQIGGNQGDYDLTIGSTRIDDVENGVVIPSIAENGSDPHGTNQFGGANIAVTTSGGETYWRIGSQSGGSEYNTDVAGAYFPYNRYLGGYLRNATIANGATNDTFTGSSGLVLGTHVYGVANGRSVVDLTSFGIDSRTDGILLVTHAKDENNWALSAVDTTNGTWNVAVKDLNSASAGSVEQDPLAFVYIPKSDTNLVSGRFYGDGTIALHSGSTPQFTITPVGGGRWVLKLSDYGPTNGVLIISAEGGMPFNQDNIVSYEPTAAGDAWEIQSRDTPGNGLQTPGGGTEPVASFVFIPAGTAGFTVTPTDNLLTTESAGTATFTVALHTLPKADVTINVASDNAAEGTTDVSSLTFTPANWNVPQTVTVTGQDDANTDGPVTYNVVLSPATSTDPVYNGVNPQDVAVINADNEAGITVSATTLSTAEPNGTATFTVRLNTAPVSDVVVEVSSTDVSEGTVSPAQLFFTPGDWDQPRTVTVTGVDDLVDDGNVAYSIVTAAALSSDPIYNGVNPTDVAMVNLDNDSVGIVASPANGLTVNESGTTAAFTVKLASQPTANVTINLGTSDASEGTVAPTTLTFTSSDWATPKNATLTGVNDAANDGDIAYSVTGSVTSADALYAALQLTISATTVDNEAALTLPSGTLTYAIGTPGTSIDAAATVEDADTANYNSGSLTVALTANASPDDRLEIRNSGTGLGQIGIAGNTVSYEGVSIGTFSGGVGSAPLVVNLNSAATPAAAQALVRSITFRNLNQAPSMAPRTVVVTLADGAGGTSTASKSVLLRLMRTFNFQEGVDHGFGPYFGGADIELNGIEPDTAFPAGSSTAGLWVAWQGGIQNRNVLIRFDNIFGDGPTQIPTNAIIVSADLILNAADGGDGSPLHRMLQTWDATNATWNSVGGGVIFDDSMARSTYDSQIGVADMSGSTTTGRIEVSVTPDLQAWANGEPNHGWVMAGWPFNGDGTGFTPNESADPTLRPQLRVKWLPAGTANVSFRQGVDGYSGTRDTRIGEDAPDMDFSATPILFVDGEANGGQEDETQVLIRFNDIIGSNPGQVPAGATIHAAVLEVAALGNNAMGDGGRFHALLKPWEDTTSTWTWWNSRGILTDGIDALPTPTAVAGNASLNPDVQGGYLNYELTPDVQAWANGVRPNYGWAILPWALGGNGWGIGMSESVNELERPQLRVYYTPGDGSNVQVVLLNPTVTPSLVTVRFTGAIGSTYTVLRSASVNGTYSSIGTATVQGDGTATFNDNAPLSGTAFYRISNP